MRIWLLTALLLAGCAGQDTALPQAASFTLARAPAPVVAQAAGDKPSQPAPANLDGTNPPDVPRNAKPSAAAGSGGGGSAGEAPEPAIFTIEDSAGLPISGATVMLVNGNQATSDAQGQAVIAGGFASGPVAVSASGYATSIVVGLDGSTILHLRAAGAVGGAFTPAAVTLHGSVSWPSSDHVGGVAYYQDDLDSIATPSRVATDGTFAIPVRPTQPGTPHGVVLVLAGDSGGDTLMGASSMIASPTAPLPAIAMAVADQTVNFHVDALPTGLTHVTSKLEVLEAGAPPIVITGVGGTQGSFQVPATGALPGTLCVLVGGRDDADDAESSVSLPTTGSNASGTFLPLPVVDYSAGARTLNWQSVPGANGYRASASAYDNAEPSWEAWCAAPTTFTLPDAAWLAPGVGEVTVQAIDDPNLGAREVASLARQLRVTPWQQQGAYRVSRRRVVL